MSAHRRAGQGAAAQPVKPRLQRQAIEGGERQVDEAVQPPPQPGVKLAQQQAAKQA